MFIRIAVWSCLIASAALASNDNQGTIKKSAEVDGVSLHMAIAETTYTGLPVKVSLTLKNNRDKELGYWHIGKYRNWDLRVEDSNGKPVSKTSYGRVVIGGPRALDSRRIVETLAAGKAVETTINLGLVFDLTKPGPYRLSLSREVEHSADIEKKITVKIENVTFTMAQQDDPAN